MVVFTWWVTRRSALRDLIDLTCVRRTQAGDLGGRAARPADAAPAGGCRTGGCMGWASSCSILAGPCLQAGRALPVPCPLLSQPCRGVLCPPSPCPAATCACFVEQLALEREPPASVLVLVWDCPSCFSVPAKLLPPCSRESWKIITCRAPWPRKACICT